MAKRKPRDESRVLVADRFSFAPQIKRHEVQIEWSQFAGFPTELICEQLTKLCQLCNDARKDELVILNIAPSFRVGTDNFGDILTIQDDIASTLLLVTAPFQPVQPEIRLSLRRGEFDMRVYLGTTCPRDFEYADER
jgi:hypothetical protein